MYLIAHILHEYHTEGGYFTYVEYKYTEPNENNEPVLWFENTEPYYFIEIIVARGENIPEDYVEEYFTNYTIEEELNLFLEETEFIEEANVVH
jgi:hypothetical protein